MSVWATGAVGIFALLAAIGTRAEPLSAPAAAAALQRGVTAWDLRPASAGPLGLPGAVRDDAPNLDRWLLTRDVTTLSAAVTNAGIDLSRGVVIYGEAGDARVQAIVESLQGVATGGVYWLVGGTVEWQLAGLALAPATFARRLPVPQRLAPPVAAAATAMADHSRRGTPEVAIARRVSLAD